MGCVNYFQNSPTQVISLNTFGRSKQCTSGSSSSAYSQLLYEAVVTPMPRHMSL